MNKKILIIEDETNLRTVLKDKLTKEGYEVLEASNGAEGVNSAKVNQPDLILLDIIMPKENGLDVLKDIRNTTSLISTPVFVLTNLADEKSAEVAKKLGATEYLIKSNIKVEDLALKIKDTLNKGEEWQKQF